MQVKERKKKPSPQPNGQWAFAVCLLYVRCVYISCIEFCWWCILRIPQTENWTYEYIGFAEPNPHQLEDDTKKKSAARIVRIISFPFRKRINYSAANTYIQQQQQKHMAHTAAWSVHRAKCVCVPFWSCRWSSSKRRWMKKKKSSTLSNYANFSARCIFSNVFSWWYFAMLLVAISIFLQWNIHYHRFRRSIMIFFLDCLLDAFLYTLQ